MSDRPPIPPSHPAVEAAAKAMFRRRHPHLEWEYRPDWHDMFLRNACAAVNAALPLLLAEPKSKAYVRFHENVSKIVRERDEARAALAEQEKYPHHDGDFTVIGPECFADERVGVIAWRGENYVKQEDAVRERDEARAALRNAEADQAHAYPFSVEATVRCAERDRPGAV